MVSNPPNDVFKLGSVDLQKREREILRLMILHGSISAVATAIGLSERHTRRLIRSLQQRAGVANTHALIAWAITQDVCAAPTDLLKTDA